MDGASLVCTSSHVQLGSVPERGKQLGLVRLLEVDCLGANPGAPSHLRSVPPQGLEQFLRLLGRLSGCGGEQGGTQVQMDCSDCSSSQFGSVKFLVWILFQFALLCSCVAHDPPQSDRAKDGCLKRV